LQVDQRGATLEADDLDHQPFDRLRPGPGLHQFHRPLHVAVGNPVGVEHRRLVGDADVLDQLRDDVLVPHARDETVDGGAVQRGGGGGHGGPRYASASHSTAAAV